MFRFFFRGALLSGLAWCAGSAVAGGETCERWLAGSTGAVLNGSVRDAVTWDPDGAGPAGPSLVLGGDFSLFGSTPVARVALWNGVNLAALGGGIPNGSIFAVAEHQGRLIVGGQLISPGGGTDDLVRSWDGSAWQRLGAGVRGVYVRAFATYNHDLIVAGEFDTAGGAPARSIARWDGAVWHALGAGLDMFGAEAVAVFQGDLIVTGFFTQAGGIGARAIASWNPARAMPWRELGGGLRGGLAVGSALLVYQDELIIGGRFTSAGDVSAQNLARWNGATWTAFAGGANQEVTALGSYRGELVAGGHFTQIGGAAAARIARWSPAAGWRAFDGGADARVDAIAEYAGALVIGGMFRTVGEAGSPFWARWGRVYVLGDSDGDGAVDFSDIDCFVAAVIGPTAWRACGTRVPASEVAGYTCVNDLNLDAVVNFDDIDGFVTCLIAAGCE